MISITDAYDTNKQRVRTKRLRAIERADPLSFHEFCGEELARARRLAERCKALPDEQAYNEDELRAKFAEAWPDRKERLQGDRDRGRYLSSSHISPQTVDLAEIAEISPDLASDIRQNFGEGATLELAGDTVHVIPDGIDRKLGAVQLAGEDTDFDEISANVEFRHGGSRVKASRHRVKDRSAKGPEHGGGIRGTITGFSREARKRLMDFVAELRRDERPYFVTLTYPDHFPTDPETWKNDLKKLFRRLSRRVPRAAVVWRLELETRKSGENKGQLAPHFHLLVYNTLDFDLASFIEEHWHDIAGDGDEKHRWVHSKQRGREKPKEAAVRLMQSWRHCAAYTAKELAKTAQSLFESYTIEVDQRKIHDGGIFGAAVESRVTGEILALCEDIEAAREVELYRAFVYNSDGLLVFKGSLAECEQFVESVSQYPDGVGRFWGAWGREYLPWVPALVVWTLDNAAERMLRIMEAHAGVADYPYHKTMSVMCEATIWLRIFSRLLSGEIDPDSFTVTVEALP